ncbi:hypothetical protein Asulf_00474 [Archaeoglobus sulfaticallidus PM70-1]|uniref:FIST domain-containing protein n=1 Tax=Archaeoglobus sulfaticallidus PM70-1 TaxID=387631 RepID=N0BJ70_9EURY|nr:hypothetical protein [Archaeoglobus sulfaticallidus]AGK60501.1 hypothetical protein Asulf_00474 [Archaeoglobus sulfaticallidus PM70-1]
MALEGKIIHTQFNEYQHAREELIEEINKIKKSGFEVDFILLFFTKGTMNDYLRYNEIFKKNFPDAQMLGCVIEGYMVEEEVWTIGLVAMLANFDGKVQVFWESGNDARVVSERVGRKIGDKWDVVLAMFPAFYFPSKLRFLEAFLKDRIQYVSYRNKGTKEEKEEILRNISRYYRENFIYPVDEVLEGLGRHCNAKIIGMNLMPIEAQPNMPVILANYRDIGRGLAVMCFKGKVNAMYHDIFPERGSSLEEVEEIIRGYFSYVEEVEVVKADVAIGEINGVPSIEFLKSRRAFEEIDENKFINKLERGRVEMVSPYGLLFTSKATFGCAPLGLITSPVKVYPSIFNLDLFVDSCFFVGESFKGGIDKFLEIFNFRKLDNFDILFMDINVIPAFGSNLTRLSERIGSNNKLVLFTSNPSMSFESSTKYFTNIKDSLYFTTYGSTTLLEF